MSKNYMPTITRSSLLIGGGFCGGLIVSVQVYSQLNQFKRRFKKVFICEEKKEVFCRGRKAFKDSINLKLNNPNPSGIIFITGKKNSGKTTAIQSVLSEKEYVAHINWRSIDKISSTQKLTSSLKSAFEIGSF